MASSTLKLPSSKRGPRRFKQKEKEKKHPKRCFLKKKKKNVGVQNSCLEKKSLRGWGETLGPRSAFQNGMDTKH